VTTTVAADSFVAAGFEPVADAFTSAFRDGLDDGAACAVYVEGHLAVHLWAGYADGQTPWMRDTAGVVYSVSKGILSIAVLMAAERGLLELDAPISSYWPEFAAQGKRHITVRHAMAHRAGLSMLDNPITLDDVRAWTPVTDAIARQRPAWSPEAGHVYHALTMGWLLGEVLRRCSGLRPQQWLTTQIARPLAARLSYGLPHPRPLAPMLDPLTPPPPSADLAHLTPEAFSATSLGGLFDPARLFEQTYLPEIMQLELPAANLVADAHSLARIYAATTGPVDGVTLLKPHTVRDALRPQTRGPQLVGPPDKMRWGSGFMLASDALPLLGPTSYGHDGAGGHLAFADLSLQVGFGYQTRRPGATQDGRTQKICAALRSCL
jgi:CubicO group peptidase (beta-lactamase class C family)